MRVAQLPVVPTLPTLQSNHLCFADFIHCNAKSDIILPSPLYLDSSAARWKVANQRQRSSMTWRKVSKWVTGENCYRHSLCFNKHLGKKNIQYTCVYIYKNTDAGISWCSQKSGQAPIYIRTSVLLDPIQNEFPKRASSLPVMLIIR